MDATALRPILALAAAGVGIYLSFRVALPFVAAFTWALVLAAAVAPLHRVLEARIGKPGPAAMLTVLIASVLAGLPLLMVLRELALEAAAGIAYFDDLLAAVDWNALGAQFPWLAAPLAWLQARMGGGSPLNGLVGWVGELGNGFFVSSVTQGATLVITFYVLYYFLRDRRLALATLVAYSPFTARESMRLFERFADTVRASMFGLVAVSAVQGALGAAMFWWLGLPMPVFWGIVMALLAIIPFLGAFVVWVPAAVLLALQARWADAALLSAWGGVVIATVDNLLYPLMVGNRLRLHTLVVLVGAIGGLVVFGAAGIVLGPTVIAVTLEMIAIFRERGSGRRFPISESGSAGRRQNSSTRTSPAR